MTQVLLSQRTKGFSRELLEALSAFKGEPGWLRQRRLAAWKTYQATPMPTLQDEDWRRTDISIIPFADLVAYQEPPSRSLASLANLPQEMRSWLDIGEAHAGHILVHDSEVVYRELAEAARQDGVLFTSLAEAVAGSPELAQAYLLGATFAAERGKFAALNAALFSDGAFVYVPKGVDLALPLRITHWLSSSGVALIPHTVIVIEEGARASLVQEYFSPSLAGPSLLCPGIEVVLKPGASLNYVSVQQLGTSVFVLGTQRHLLDKDSRLEYMAIAVGGRLTKFYADSLLQGEGSLARMLGVVFADGEQHFDHQTLQEHVAANTTSDMLFKVVVKDRAMSVHYGKVHVRKGARATDAGQAVRNLILSEGAKAHPIMPLEIEAADIKRCSHAATIGQVDENQLFYLMSRGLTRRQAEKLVVEGFFAPLVEEIPLAGVRERLRRVLDSKLPPD